MFSAIFRYFPRLFTGCLLWITVVTPGFLSEANADTLAQKPAYTFGIFPFLPVTRLETLYAPIVKQLSDGLKRPIAFQVGSSFNQFMQNLQGQQYDIAFIQPFDYTGIGAPLGYVPLVTRTEELSGVIVVKPNSPILNIKALKGKTIASPPKVAAVSYLNKLSLINAGLDPSRDVIWRYQKNQVSCLQQILLDTADACGTAPPALRHFESRMGIKLRILQYSPSIAHALFVAHPRIPDNERKKLIDILLSFKPSNEGRAHFLKNGDERVFKPVTDSDYDPVRTYWKRFSEGSEEPARVSGDSCLLGIFPHHPPRQIDQIYGFMAKQFTQATGCDFELKTASSFAAFRKNLERRLYHVVLVQPFDYVYIADRFGYEAIARQGDPLTAVFVTLPEANARTLQELEGQTIALPPETAAVSRLARSSLLGQGVVPTRDVVMNYTVSHSSCIQQMMMGKAVVCVTSRQALRISSRTLDFDYRILYESPAIPHILFAVSPILSQRQKKAVGDTFFSWSNTTEGQKLLARQKLGPYVPVSDTEYDSVRQLLKIGSN